MTKLILLLAMSASLPALAQECYTVDAARGSVTYELKQAGSPFRGSFRRFGGELCLSADRASRVEVWLDPASTDSGLPEIDKALKDKDFFAVGQYPRIVYASQTVEARGNAQLARGILEMKGKRRRLDVPFSLQRQGDGLVASGTMTLNRLDYDIGTGEWSNTSWLGGEVKVEFRAVLGRR
jgi:polyisoprenoid-binding protein YceI